MAGIRRNTSSGGAKRAKPGQPKPEDSLQVTIVESTTCPLRTCSPESVGNPRRGKGRAMPPLRIRRNSTLTLIVGVVLLITISVFLTSSSSDSTSQLRKAQAAAHPLSPPTSPFRKQSTKANAKRVPPPVVHYHMNNVTSTSDPIGNRETVLILTPLARFYQGYWDNLLRLSYPHELITLGFITPKNREGNAATAALQEQIAKTQKLGPQKERFASIIIERQDFDPPTSQNEADRHKMENQKERRAAISRARNSLLFTTLGPSTSWVLWLDSDIVESPPTLIQDLAAHDKPIIVPNCWQRFYDGKEKQWFERPYDFNSWQDSQVAQDMVAKMGRDDILLEGYAEMATYRTLMAHMAQDGGDVNLEMELDGVGGTALLVKADVHRDGAMFPPFPFYHLIETEGFAKMAKRLGRSSTGLPNYKVGTLRLCLTYGRTDSCRSTITTNEGVRLQPHIRSVHSPTYCWTI